MPRGYDRLLKIRYFQSTRRGQLRRQGNVTVLAATRSLWCVLLAGLVWEAAAGPSGLDALLKTIENRYNHSQSLRLDFTESYAGTSRPVQKEWGVLYLRKPGKMRWDYSSPAGKIFISDGKDVVLYTPGDATAQKSKLKESEDMRAPLAFLLGKLEFRKEFQSFQTRGDGADTWITAEPKSQNLAYTKVEFLAAPDGEIQRVNVTGQDQSTLDFTFTNEKLNAPVEASMFRFQPPPGVQVEEAAQ